MPDPAIGSTWYEDDKRFPVARRAVRVLEIKDGRVAMKRLQSGLITHAKLSRFGQSGGYKEFP